MKPLIAALALTLLLGTGAARAGEPVTRYRGTVVERDGDTLTLRRAGGDTVTMEMTPKTRMLTATPAQLRDIKPESYVTVIAAPGAGRAQAITGVTVYSPSERGFMEGARSWDTSPGATLTSGWIGTLSGDGPREVELVFDGGTKTFSLPDGTPAVQMTPGEKALLVAGSEAVAFTHAGPDGRIVADLVAVGRRGAVPNL